MPEFPTLAAGTHAVYRLAPDLLLVFKPRGHREELHAHPHRQRLRILRGALLVRMPRRTVTLDPSSAAFSIVRQCRHATEALDDTWLVAETVAPARSRLPSRRRGS